MIQFVQVAFSPCLYPDMLDVDVPNLRAVEYCKALQKTVQLQPRKNSWDGLFASMAPFHREDPSLRSNAGDWILIGVLGMVVYQIQGDGLIMAYHIPVTSCR